jgi:hypothetical protein
LRARSRAGWPWPRPARDAITGPITGLIAAVALLVLLSKKIDTLWVIAGSSLVSLGAALFGLV